MTEVAILLDIYGKMLTQRQQEVMAAYYEDDLSLGEIAENLNITRPGVHDLVQRSKSQLQSWEAQLGLAQKDDQRRKVVSGIRNLTEEALKLAENERLKEKIRLIQEGLAKIERI